MAKKTEQKPIDWDNFFELSKQAGEKLRQHNEKLGKGIVVGKIFQIPVADGHAFYKVVKIFKKVVKVKWVKNNYLNPDQYVDLVLGYEGTIKRPILELIMKELS